MNACKETADYFRICTDYFWSSLPRILHQIKYHFYQRKIMKESLKLMSCYHIECEHNFFDKNKTILKDKRYNEQKEEKISFLNIYGKDGLNLSVEQRC